MEWGNEILLFAAKLKLTFFFPFSKNKCSGTIASPASVAKRGLGLGRPPNVSVGKARPRKVTSPLQGGGQARHEFPSSGRCAGTALPRHRRESRGETGQPAPYLQDVATSPRKPVPPGPKHIGELGFASRRPDTRACALGLCALVFSGKPKENLEMGIF